MCHSKLKNLLSVVLIVCKAGKKDEARLMLGYPDDEYAQPKCHLGRNAFDRRQSFEPMEKPYVKIEIDVCFSWYYVYKNYRCS